MNAEPHFSHLFKAEEETFMISKSNIPNYLKSSLNIESDNITNIIPMSEGMVNIVFKIELKNGQSMIVKHFLSKPKSNRFSSFELPTADRLNASSDSQALIHQQNPELVSKILHTDPANSILIETAFESTSSLHTQFEEYKLTQTIIQNLANSLKEIHNISFDSLDQNMNNTFTNLKLQNKYLGYDFLDENLQELLKNTAQNYLQTHSCLVHGDMASTNILVNKNDQSTYLIDFEGAHIGNPEFDLGFILAELIFYDLSNPNKNLETASEVFFNSYFEANSTENLSIHTACLILYLFKGRGGNLIKHIKQESNARTQAYNIAMNLLNEPSQNILKILTKYNV